MSWPHVGPISNIQLAEPPSSFARLPSSHCSTPARVNPSPQLANTQELRQASLLLPLPSSHCSLPSVTPLPHVWPISNRQLAEQPSPLMRLPSSHCSTPTRVNPSPQLANTQELRRSA